MTGKNITLAFPWEYNNKKFISKIDYQDIFWNIFESGQFGVALSDEHGFVLVSNLEFTTKIVGKSGIDLSLLVNKDHGGKVIAHDIVEFTIHTSYYTIVLSRMELADKPGGAAFLWLTQLSPEISSKQIKLLRDLYHSFIDNTFELIFRTSHEDELTFANKLFIKCFAFDSYSKVKGIKLRDLFYHPEEFDALKQRILVDKQISNETVHFKKQDGKQLVGSVNCKLSYDNTNKLVYNWTVLDISERFEYEQDLRTKNEQLAKVNSQMERFLYSTSHDLRSPLTSILGLVNLLRLETKEEVVHNYIMKIEDCTLKLDNIIKEIMSFSKANYQRVKSEKTDFEQLVWRVINSLRDDANFLKIFFEVKTVGDAPFYSDPERVVIMLENLIRNAIIFYDPNKVRPFVRINIHISAEEVIIDVIDNGIGIAQHHLNNVFNMFYKVSDRSRGAGLGLYVVKESIQHLHGQIYAESEIGFGSIFHLTIPNDRKGKLINRKLQLQRGSSATV